MKKKPGQLSAGVEAVKVGPDGRSAVDVALAAEVPFGIYAGEREIATLMCSPSDLKAFVYGFLYTSRFISGADEVKSFKLDKSRWRGTAELERLPVRLETGKRLYTAGCGQGVIYYTDSDLPDELPLEEMNFAAREVLDVMAKFQAAAKRPDKPRGLHTAALFSLCGSADIVMEDVGRHNAVDKAVGSALLAGTDLKKSILITSGRVSSEILHKSARCGIPLVICLGSPTHHSVLLARNMNMTLIGMARGGSFTVFTGEERIKS